MGTMKWMNLLLLIQFHTKIRKHDSVEILYGKKLVDEGIISEDEMNEVIDGVQKKCEQHMIKLIKMTK